MDYLDAEKRLYDLQQHLVRSFKEKRTRLFFGKAKVLEYARIAWAKLPKVCHRKHPDPTKSLLTLTSCGKTIISFIVIPTPIFLGMSSFCLLLY